MDPRKTQYQGQGRATQYNQTLPPYPQPNQAGATNLCWPSDIFSCVRPRNLEAANNRQTQYAQYEQDHSWPEPDYGGPRPERSGKARQQNQQDIVWPGPLPNRPVPRQAQPASDGWTGPPPINPSDEDPCWKNPGCPRAANDSTCPPDYGTDPAIYTTNLHKPTASPPIFIPKPRPRRHS